MPKGEKVLAQSKSTAPPTYFFFKKKESFQLVDKFQISILLCSKGGEK
jgi:hypothetical protein